MRRRRQLVVLGMALVVGVGFGTAAAAGDASPGSEAVSTSGEHVAAPVLRAMAATQVVDVDLPVATVPASPVAAPTTVPAAVTTAPAAPTTASTTTTVARVATTTTTTAPPETTTTTAPPPPPPPSNREGSVEAALQRWFGDVYAQASDVAWCESRHDPSAVSSGGGNHGLFQINTVHRSSFEQVTGVAWSDGIYDAGLNSQFARWLYDREGWSPWACG